MNTYIVGMQYASGAMEKTIPADRFTYNEDTSSMEFYIAPSEDDEDQDDILVASFAWGAGMYIFKKDSDGRTNSASA